MKYEALFLCLWGVGRGSGGMSPREILDFGPSKIVSDGVLSLFPMLFTITFTVN